MCADSCASSRSSAGASTGASWGCCGSSVGGDLRHDAVDLVAVDGDVRDDEPAARARPAAPAVAPHALRALRAREVALVPQEVPHPAQLREEVRRAVGLGRLLPAERDPGDGLVPLDVLVEEERRAAPAAAEDPDVAGRAHRFLGRPCSARRAQRCASASNAPGSETLQTAAPRSTARGRETAAPAPRGVYVAWERCTANVASTRATVPSTAPPAFSSKRTRCPRSRWTRRSSCIAAGIYVRRWATCAEIWYLNSCLLSHN